MYIIHFDKLLDILNQVSPTLSSEPHDLKSWSMVLAV